MNNFTVGGTNWAYYETIGGGQGASAKGCGRHARQCHMTNTRITDVEVLEQRVPLRIQRFEIRKKSGGIGRHPGGDGLVREFQLLQRAEVSMLAAWRTEGARGLTADNVGKQDTQPSSRTA